MLFRSNRGLIAMIPELRRKYYLNKIPRLTSDVTVAVHVRRGDVSETRNKHYFTSTDTVLRTAALVKSNLDAHGVSYRIGVYSQGDRHDFEEFSLQLAAELFIDADPIWTMRELIEADILIMAKGSFSACAAFISDGIKLIESKTEPEIPKMEELIVREPDGSFDVAKFEKQLQRLLEVKMRAHQLHLVDDPSR